MRGFFYSNLEHDAETEPLPDRNIMRDNMLVNVSGVDGHAMPRDQNIEHLIGRLKVKCTSLDDDESIHIGFYS